MLRTIVVFLLLAGLVVGDGDSNPSPVYQASSTAGNSFQPSALFKVVPSSAPVPERDQGDHQGDQPVYSETPYINAAPSVQPTPGDSKAGYPAVPDHGQYNTYAGPYQGYSPYEPGYGVQSGYEGYLIPSQHYNTHLADVGGDNQLSLIGDEFHPLSFIWAIVPSAAAVVSFLATSGLVILKGLGVILLGTLAVLGVCTFTPFCTLTINGLGAGLLREEMRGIVTPDKISAAARFVRDAVKKYEELNNLKSN